MIPAILAAALLSAPAPGATEAAPVPADRAALVEGKLPDDPARALLQAKCLICHTADYVTQQRLSEGQWQKTVDKMKRWGAPLTDEQAKALTSYLGRHWTLDLPERRSAPVPAPAGSTPKK